MDNSCNKEICEEGPLMTNNNEEEPQWQVNQNRHTRFRTIVSVLRRYNVLSNLARQKNPDQVRAAFEELGPTFIKIGQILSSRTDVVKPEFANEFKNCKIMSGPMILVWSSKRSSSRQESQSMKCLPSLTSDRLHQHQWARRTMRRCSMGRRSW